MQLQAYMMGLLKSAPDRATLEEIVKLAQACEKALPQSKGSTQELSELRDAVLTFDSSSCLCRDGRIYVQVQPLSAPPLQCRAPACMALVLDLVQ